MIARLALLLLAVAVASAEHLRTDAHAVPVDDARGARVLQRMQQKAAAKHTKAVKATTEALKTHRDASKKGLEAQAHSRALEEGGFDTPWSKVVTKGSRVTRTRPNSDCSGAVMEITVEPAGACYNNGNEHFVGVGTYVSDSGELLRSAAKFPDIDCSGIPEEVKSFSEDPVKPCQMQKVIRSTGPVMVGTVLTDMSVAEMAANEKVGIYIYISPSISQYLYWFTNTL
jgi:hypothetical protein